MFFIRFLIDTLFTLTHYKGYLFNNRQIGFQKFRNGLAWYDIGEDGLEFKWGFDWVKITTWGHSWHHVIIYGRRKKNCWHDGIFSFETK